MEFFLILTVLFAVTSSITTFDKRLIQAKKLGDIPHTDPMLPSWVAFVYWIHYGNMLVMIILNWQLAIGTFILGFILEVLPVWETIGNVLMRPFRPKA